MNVEERCNHLLNPSGIVYESLNAIMEGFKAQKRDKFHFIDYNDLVNNPQKELDSIYDFLGEESFEHSFDNLNKTGLYSEESSLSSKLGRLSS